MSISDTISSYGRLRPQYKLGFAERFKASEFEKALKEIFKQERMKDVHPLPCKMYDTFLAV
jgi:hypothetical protein